MFSTLPLADLPRILPPLRVACLCENYAVVTLFFLKFPLFIARPPVLSTTLKGIIMHSRLLQQHVARAYGQDTLYWL